MLVEHSEPSNTFERCAIEVSIARPQEGPASSSGHG